MYRIRLTGWLADCADMQAVVHMDVHVLLGCGCEMHVCMFRKWTEMFLYAVRTRIFLLCKNFDACTTHITLVVSCMCTYMWVCNTSFYICIQKRPQEYMEQIFQLLNEPNRKKMVPLEKINARFSNDLENWSYTKKGEKWLQKSVKSWLMSYCHLELKQELQIASAE